MRGTGTLSCVGILLALTVVPLFFNSYHLHLANLVLLYIIVTSSLRTVYISGQLSLGHAAFMGIGAYTSGMLSKYLGWPPWCTIPVGAVAAMVAGILVGFPLSRLRAIYFSMASLFFGVMMTALTGVLVSYTGYLGGLPDIPRLLGSSEEPYYYFFLVLTLLSLLFLYRVEYSRTGMAFKSVAQSYLTASSRGIDEAAVRIRALGIGCFFAGLSGACYAHYNTFISPSNFGVMPSILLFTYLLIGGTRSFAGPVVGAGVLYLVPYCVSVLEGYAPLVFAGVLALLVYLAPEGIVGLPHQVISKWRGVRQRRRLSEHAS